METKWCEIHKIEMPQFEKEGRKWFSHKLEDESWCNGKPKIKRVRATYSISKKQGEFTITYTTDDRADFEEVLRKWSIPITKSEAEDVDSESLVQRKVEPEEEYPKDPELDELLK
mgnify:CR=1 FL=1